jgi:hypothetical protein
MSDPLHDTAERRIQEALEAGLFRGLPGEGRPLALDDLSGMPEELRASYLVLRNAGALPEELELRRTVLRIDDLIAACRGEDELRELRMRRNSAALRFSILMERRGHDRAHAELSSRLAERLDPHDARDASRGA